MNAASPSSSHFPPLRIGLAGFGRVAPTHVDAIAGLGPAAVLSAICDPDPAARAAGTAATGAKGFASLRELLDTEPPEVIAICTPSGLHAQLGMEAAAAGCHVIVEKPVDVTPDSAQALYRACLDHGVKLLPILQNRLNTTVQLLRRAILAGRFGRIYSLNATLCWSRKQDYYDSADWRGRRALDGGAFTNQGIHFLDVMRFLGGEVVETSAMLGRLARNIECEDSGSALLRFASGALGNLFVTMLAHQHSEGSLTVLGEQGTVRLGGSALNTVDYWHFDTPDPEMDALAANAEYHTASVYGNGHKLFYAEVLRHLREGTPLTAPPEDALRSLDLLHRIVAASEF